jgi:hypothetical protein
MNIQNLIKIPFGRSTATLRYYEAQVKTGRLLIHLHGIGEIGPADGSQLDEVEAHGLTRYAKGIRPGESLSSGALELPFNIAAFQVPVTNYSSLGGMLIPWAKAYFQPTALGAWGFSMGAYGITDNLLRFDPAGWLDFIVSISGRVPSTTIIPSCRAVRTLAFHGDAEGSTSAAPYLTTKRWFEEYNLQKGNPVEFVTLPGEGHIIANMLSDGTPPAGIPDPIAWIITRFQEKEAQAPPGYELGRADMLDAVKLVIDQLQP